jgi:hypothetical protein
MPCQKVGSLTQAPRASIQSWAVALAIASRSAGVRSSRNCCRSSVRLRVMGCLAVESIVAGRRSGSVPVQEVRQCLTVLCLRLKGPSADGAGVGCLRSEGGILADLPLSQSALADQVSNVGVGSHSRFVWYETSIGGQRATRSAVVCSRSAVTVRTGRIGSQSNQSRIAAMVRRSMVCR